MAAYSVRGTKEKSPKRQDIKGSMSNGQLSLPGVQEVMQKLCQPGGSEQQALIWADHPLGHQMLMMTNGWNSNICHIVCQRQGSGQI